MSQDKFEMFRNRVLKLYRHRSKQAKRLNISCYRLYDRDLPEFPLRIEFYGEHLYVAEYQRRHGMTEEEHEDWLTETSRALAQTLEVEEEKIHMKLRYRKQGRRDQYQKLDAAGTEMEVMENGLRFLVNLSDYLDTGLFLDHRVTRQQVRENSQGKRVLNLFAYTGSFSVYAAAGGATEVVTADLSKTYLAWAERNMGANGFTDPERYKYMQADVMELLTQLPPGYFDIIVMDPPTFSNSKRMEEFLDIQRDHVRLLADCLRITKEGGRTWFSTNYTKFELDREKIPAASIQDITRSTTPFDFEKKLDRWCYLIEK